MTRTEMEQLRSIPEEIKAIEQTLKNPRIEWVNVYYKDYRTGKGIPKSRTERDYDHQEWRKLKHKLQRKIEKLKSLIVEAEFFLTEIDDSEMRTILRSYYINGKTQDGIAKALHCDRSTISRKIDRFWEEQKNLHTIHTESDV